MYSTYILFIIVLHSCERVWAQMILMSTIIYSESSDWEAKFYQIQSKYLLLLNELHNPQVGVSASRQEMVSQLLKVRKCRRFYAAVV